MTAPGVWCVEPLVVERCGRIMQRFRVTRMGVFVGEVASPQQLAKLSVLVAELVEEDQAPASPRDGRRRVRWPLRRSKPRSDPPRRRPPGHGCEPGGPRRRGPLR
jgi:hypothetical protein